MAAGDGGRTLAGPFVVFGGELGDRHFGTFPGAERFEDGLAIDFGPLLAEFEFGFDGVDLHLVADDAVAHISEVRFGQVGELPIAAAVAGFVLIDEDAEAAGEGFVVLDARGAAGAVDDGEVPGGDGVRFRFVPVGGDVGVGAVEDDGGRGFGEGLVLGVGGGDVEPEFAPVGGGFCEDGGDVGDVEPTGRGDDHGEGEVEEEVLDEGAVLFVVAFGDVDRFLGFGGGGEEGERVAAFHWIFIVAAGQYRHPQVC